ncbi:MAG: glutamine-hydrolyzing GMP synthase [Candidatus Margulisbacteria bacterium]|nr:glutamine-hydrolyzing GMP synthase [Candidatus Margulisiibacteriota bacterium]
MLLILDFGSQYSKLIARRVRECKVYCEIIPGDSSLEKIKAHNPEAIILSGGPSSVYDDNAPKCDKEIFKLGIPILGICYGLQLMAYLLGGEVVHFKKHEYGKTELIIDDSSDLFSGIWENITVWMSHGDSVTKLPPGFGKIAHSDNTPFAAVANKEKKFYGVQFHPEVVHTQQGTDIIKNFVYNISGLSPSWNMKNFVEETIEEIRQTVGKEKVLLALSGGVDSTTTAVLLQKAIGDQLVCMFIDQGFMRKNEAQKIVELFNKHFKIRLIHIDASIQFFEKIKDVIDPEQKRKIIGHEFIHTFEVEAKKLKGNIPFLAQGTLYPDVIESATTGVSKNAAKIKTHHNVGGLPEKMNFKIIEPLKKLFKDEVRQVGVELGVPETIVFRQPFPGPGLAIRIIGEVTPERVKVVQEADDIVMAEIKKAGLYRKLWQAFAVLLPIRSVGVMGDKRTYLSTIAVRVVTSEDAMTANWAHLPYDVLGTISNRIINEIPEVNRVVYDITSKPPSTIEWE